MNRALLSKCRSNESLQHVRPQAVERPRSITVDQQSPAAIPKWAQLASIVRHDFSPSQALAQSFHSASQPTQVVRGGRLNAQKPPAIPNRRRDNAPGETSESRVEVCTPLNQAGLRTRAESLYLPGASGQPRSPLGLGASPAPLNSTYYQRALPSDSSQLFIGQYQSLAPEASQLFNACQQLRPLVHVSSATARQAAALSQSADLHRGFFTALVSPTFGPARPVGGRPKPEVAELIERQRSRINSQTRRELLYSSNAESAPRLN